MDARRDITMTIAKYSAYMGIMVAIIFEKNSNFVISVTLCSLLIVIGSLRQYIIEDQYNYLKKYTFIVDLALVTALGVLSYNGVYVIGYCIIIVEGVLLSSYVIGLILSIATFISYGIILIKFNGISSTKELLLVMFYNSLAFIFFYAISYSAKRQIEQREQLEETIEKLKLSKMELEDANERLLLSNKRIQELAVIDERNRMAREIHDTLAHTLTTVIVEIEAGKKLLKKGTGGALEELEKAQNAARIGLDEVRHSVKNLRSGILSKEGFKGALKMTLEQIEAMGGTNINLSMDDEIEISEEYEMALFRIIQEAATNSFRHGKSKNIYITLKEAQNEIMLDISDDGIGCENIKQGFGIIGIKERVSSLGGHAGVESSAGKGFKINVALPREGTVIHG